MPVNAWSRPPVPHRLRAAAQGPLVGRRKELAVLEEIWAAVSGGARQALFVGGEPGVGKSRLVAEVATILADHDVAVLLGTSGADHGVPYQPFVEMLDHLFATGPPGSVESLLGDTAAALSRMTPHLAHLPAAAEAAGTVRDERRDLFDAIAGLLRSMTAVRPVVLVFEDIHWAQPPTVALLSHVVSVVSGAPLLVLATFRTTAPDRSDDLTLAIADLYHLQGVRRIDLGGLDTDDIAEYLTRQGHVSVAAARRSAPVLRDQTGGNPFFLRELWRELQPRGGLAALRSAQVPAPRSIGDTLERRLAGLDPATRAILEVAAVIGDAFEVPTLTAASGTDPHRVLAALDASAAIGLVQPAADRPGAYAFLHTLSRQAVLDRLASSRLTVLHGRVAAALEARGTEPQVVPRLALHYLRAHMLGFEQQAVHYAAAAARLAERTFAFEEAASWFEQAAAVADIDARERAGLLLAAAGNHMRSGAFARAREIYERLATAGDPDTRLRAAMGYEDVGWRPGVLGSRSADLLTDAMEASALPADDPRYVAALAALGRALTFAGVVDRAREVGERAIELARRHGDEDLLTYALWTSLWQGLGPGQAEVFHLRSTEVVERARAAGDREMLSAAAFFRARTSYSLGRPADLSAAATDYHRAAVDSGQPFIAYVGGCMEQGRSFLRGDFADARRSAEELVELGGTFGSDDTEGPYGLQMFMIQRETGELEAVRPLVGGDESLNGHWAPGLLALYTELGLEPGMRRVLRHVLDMLGGERTAGAQWPAELAFAAEAALALGDVDASLRLRPYLECYEGENLLAGEFGACFGAADRYLARIASLLGEHDRAEHHFRAALAMDEAMDSAVHTTETLLHHGLHLLRTGEQARAWKLLERARDIAEHIGQVRVLRQIPPRRPTQGPDGLTEREVEVLRLLAEGLSNREIGQRLYISANTAANHVRSILLKTESANRTQAARYATDHDLV